MSGRLLLRGLVVLLVLSTASIAAAGDEASRVERELAGIEPAPATPLVPPVPDPDARQRALELLGSTGLLLVPESTNDRVMAFDPLTGNLVDANFVPADPTHLATPIHAVLNTCSLPTILVSDQLNDVVQAYDLAGNWLSVFAPAGGPNTAILDNVRGIYIEQGTLLLVTVGAGTNADAVAGFHPATGASTGNFIANGAGGLGSPFDVLARLSDLDILVAGINSDAIHRYDFTGNSLGTLTPVNSFPEQIAVAANGNVLVANFSGTEEGVLEYTSTGTFVGLYDPVSLGGYRGVYELPNGNILTTNGSGVHEIDRSGNLVETKIPGVSARFIQFVRIDPDLIFAEGSENGVISQCWSLVVF